MEKINWKSPSAIAVAVLVFIALAVLAGLLVKYGAVLLDKMAAAVGLPAVGSLAKAYIPLAV